MIYSNYMREKYRNTNIPRTAEGYPCILKKSKKGNLKELVIEGNTGKNLFDISKITKFVKYNNGGFDIETTGSTISDGVIVNNEGLYQGSIFAWDSRTELEAGTYTLSADFMSNRDDGDKRAALYVRDYNSTDIVFQKFKELTAYKSWENVSGTFTLSKKTTIVIAPMGGGVTGDWNSLNMNIKNIQLELGSTATEYEPYKAVGEASKNLMEYPYSFGTSVTHKGVTFTVDADGAVIINGTPTGVAQCNIDTRNFLNILDSTKDYTLSGVVEPNYNSDGSYAKCQINMVFTNKGSFVKNIFSARPGFSTEINLSNIQEEFDECHIQILAYGGTFNNVKFYPQIEEGTKRTEWCPNGKCRIPLTVSGKNLFDTPGWYNWLRSFTTTYVTKKTVDETNCIYYRPQVTHDKHFMEGCFKENTQYVLTFRAKGIAGNGTSTGFEFIYTDNKGPRIYISNTDSWNNYTFISEKNKTIKYIRMTYNYGQGCYFDENSIQLELGSTATEYEPYKEPMITSIYLDNTLGSGECLDFKRQKLIKATSQTDVALPKVQVFKGTSVIRTDTEVSPTNIKAKYIKY